MIDYRKLIGYVAAMLVELAMATGADLKQGSTPVLFLTVGASSSDESVRKLGWGLPSNGWYNSVIDKRLDEWAGEFKQRDLPFRVLLHNPWGTQNGEVMDFDQAIEAHENPKLKLVCDSFGPWLESRIKPHLGENGECIIYLGSGRRDKDMLALHDQPAAYLDRLNRSVAEVPDWCSIVFDDASSLTEDHPFTHFVRLQSKIRRVYIEPRPIKDGATRFLPVVVDSRLWWRTNPERFPDAAGSAPNHECGDEVLRFMLQGDESHRRNWLQRAANDGNTVVFGYTDFWALDLQSGDE